MELNFRKGGYFMQVIWLGQGGLMLVSQKQKILIDPYMTNDLKKIDRAFNRRVSVQKKFFKLNPNIILLTNSYPANTDEDTIATFIKKYKGKDQPLTILSCEGAYNSLKDNKCYLRANPIVFGEGDQWSLDNIHIQAVKARTNDRSAFGVLITDKIDGRKYYIASNTLYNEEIINSLPAEIFAAFLPISGNYGCMNMLDAQRFAQRIDATYVVPINYGMFDKIDPELFDCAGRVIPDPFKVISFSITPVTSKPDDVLDGDFNERPLPRQESRNEEEQRTPRELDSGEFGEIGRAHV